MKIALTLLILMSVNCTGGTYGRLLGMPTTNPTPEYAHPYTALIKGGWIYHNNTISGQLGQNADGKNKGEACSKSLFYLFSWGDSSIEAAKKAGKINKVASVEYEQTGFLAIIYHGFCTIATGTNDTISSTAEAKTIPELIAKQPAKKGK